MVLVGLKFDNVKVGLLAKLNSKCKNAFPDAVPITRFQATFFNFTNQSECCCTQFPLVLAFALTVHKEQRATGNKVLVLSKVYFT